MKNDGLNPACRIQPQDPVNLGTYNYLLPPSPYNKKLIPIKSILRPSLGDNIQKSVFDCSIIIVSLLTLYWMSIIVYYNILWKML